MIMRVRIIKPHTTIGFDVDVYLSFFRKYYPKYNIQESQSNVEIDTMDDIHIYISMRYELTLKAKVRLFMRNNS